MNPERNLRDDAITIWNAGVAAVDARKLVQDFVTATDEELQIGDQVFQIKDIDRIVVVGFGKASGAMAVGFEQALGSDLLESIAIVGQVNVPDDQIVETCVSPVIGCRPLGENLPTSEVLDGTDRIIEFVRSAGPRDICVCLISGGGSALLEKPIEPITLEQFQKTSTFLSNSGASIYELNAVRRAISQVKGGGLARMSGGAPVVSLILSDVVGDNLDVIASGPTVAPTSDLIALDVLQKLDPERTGVPAIVWEVVESGQRELGIENVCNISNHIIGNVETAMVAAGNMAQELGYQVELSTPSGNEGDARTVGHGVAIQIARATTRPKPVCQIMGGETTVALCEHPGRGGRNQHLVLSTLESIIEFQLDPESEFCLLSAGTDGEDGNVSAAGACFDSSWIAETDFSDLRNQLKQSLSKCDSFDFLSNHGLIIKVPRTFTNVCDLRIVLVR